MERDISLELSDQEARDLSFQLLIDFSFSTLQALIDTAGSERAITLSRPYFHHSGNAAAIILGDSMKWKGDDKNVSGKMYEFVGSVIRSRFEYMQISGTDWQEIHIHSCPYETGPPEFCYLLDNVVANGMMEVADPTREIVLSQMRTEGAPFCILRSIIKGTSPKRPTGKEVFTSPAPMTWMTREEADSWAIQYIAEQWVMLTRGMMDFEGSEKALAIQLKNMRSLGISLGFRLQEHEDGRKKSLRQIVTLLDFCNNIFHQDGTINILSEECAERTITSCPFQNAPPATCLQHESFLKGFSDSIDDSYEIAYDQMMTKGDKTCHWTIRKKELSAREKPKEEASSDDPIKRLTNKFIDGEITEDEFERKLAILKKHSIVK